MFVGVCASDLIWLGKIMKGGGGERISSCLIKLSLKYFFFDNFIW